MKAIHRMEEGDALALLARAPAVTVAGTDAEGRPLVRHFNATVQGRSVAFHGAMRGEKMGMLDRPVVATAFENVATTPSYFVDPARACPATTYYRSVELRGVARAVQDPAEKSALLEGLMQRHQPEGGYVPLAADHPLYRSVIASLLVVRIEADEISGKQYLGQHKPLEKIVGTLEGLWDRGAPGDLRAIELLRRAHPARPVPSFLRAPEPYTLCCLPEPGDVEAAVELLRGTYWNTDNTPERIAATQRDATVWIGAHDARGRLVATARAVSDVHAYAYVGDVVVAPEHRERGLGRALVRLLLDHPYVRHARRIRLVTKDRQRFYRHFGFDEIGREDGRSVMALNRGGVRLAM